MRSACSNFGGTTPIPKIGLDTGLFPRVFPRTQATLGRLYSTRSASFNRSLVHADILGNNPTDAGPCVRLEPKCCRARSNSVFGHLDGSSFGVRKIGCAEVWDYGRIVWRGVAKSFKVCWLLCGSKPGKGQKVRTFIPTGTNPEVSHKFQEVSHIAIWGCARKPLQGEIQVPASKVPAFNAALNKVGGLP